jgi:hypothetical protein
MQRNRFRNSAFSLFAFIVVAFLAFAGTTAPTWASGISTVCPNVLLKIRLKFKIFASGPSLHFKEVEERKGRIGEKPAERRFLDYFQSQALEFWPHYFFGMRAYALDKILEIIRTKRSEFSEDDARDYYKSALIYDSERSAGKTEPTLTMKEFFLPVANQLDSDFPYLRGRSILAAEVSYWFDIFQEASRHDVLSYAVGTIEPKAAQGRLKIFHGD